jgi:murein DD-endopeptidase / murein LD-carboxypeptidase
VNKHFSIYGFYFWLSALILFTGCATSRKAARAHQAAEETKKEEVKEKYAAKLGVCVNDISNYPLYSFIDDWYGTPYHYSGHSKEGIDCSDFVCILYQAIYDTTLAGTAGDLYHECKTIPPDSSLKEGDMVFFRIKGKNISHVGVYLQNNKFIHASLHSGVVISDLNEAYYKKYYYKAGRIKS